MNRFAPGLLRTAFIALLAATVAFAQSPKPSRTVAATVGEDAVSVEEVEREFARTFKDRKMTPEAKRVAQAQMLEQLVKRRLAARYLARTKQGASESDVSQSLDRVRSELKQKGLTLQEFLKRSGLDEREFRQFLAWQVGWSQYLEKQLTDANLKKFFDGRRAEFDGTQLRVAHILLTIPTGQAPAATIERANQIRQEIKSGGLTFAEAAKKYSQAPSAPDGGDIGLIARREPMPESFSAAAFALKPGDVSPPTVTAFGVHLIQVVETKPGNKTWQDVRGDLQVAVAQHLLDWAAGQERQQVQVQYSGKYPHLKPGTNDVVNASE